MTTAHPRARYGLTHAQAALRLREYGPNVLVSERRTGSVWSWIVRLVADPMVILLGVAGATYALLGDYFDAIVVAAALVPIFAVTSIMEFRSDRALERLNELSPPRARVRRDDEELNVRARDVVPGDILLLREGDVISADATVLETSRLLVDESALTGESLPVEKGVGKGSEGNVFAGTIVKSGRAVALVERTGARTEYGSIGRTLGAIRHRRTPIERSIRRIDTVRPAAIDAIAQCRRAGIRFVMITGDHPTTARAVAVAAGLDALTVVSGEIDLTRWSEEELETRIAGIDVFARVRPEQKLRIVRALHARGDVVAMTGDGTNDALALREADIGIAMGKGGTEVARAAADLVLLDDDVTTIVRAVADGRRIFANLRHAFSYLNAFHAPLLLTAFVLPLIGAPIFLLPIHLIWLELIVHPTSALVFENDPPHENAMSRPPRKPTAGLLQAADWMRALALGGVLAGTVIAVYVVAMRGGLSVEAARSAAFHCDDNRTNYPGIHRASRYPPGLADFASREPGDRSRRFRHRGKSRACYPLDAVGASSPSCTRTVSRLSDRVCRRLRLRSMAAARQRVCSPCRLGRRLQRARCRSLEPWARTRLFESRTMLKIVVAIDGSVVARHALSAVLDLSEELREAPAVHAVAVVDYLTLPAGLANAPSWAPDLLCSDAETALAVAAEISRASDIARWNVACYRGMSFQRC